MINRVSLLAHHALAWLGLDQRENDTVPWCIVLNESSRHPGTIQPPWRWEVDDVTTRRKSIGRGDEASGPMMDERASLSMARGESIEKLEQQEHGKPVVGQYTRRLGGEYGASVPKK